NAQPEVVRRVDGRSGRIAGHAFRFDGAALDLAITGDRRRVLVTSAQADVTYELDTADLRVVATHPAGGAAVEVHPDDHTVALARGDGTMVLLDRRSSRVRQLPGRSHAPVTRIVFTPDGARLLTVAENGRLVV